MNHQRRARLLEKLASPPQSSSAKFGVVATPKSFIPQMKSVQAGVSGLPGALARGAVSVGRKVLGQGRATAMVARRTAGKLAPHAKRHLTPTPRVKKFGRWSKHFARDEAGVLGTIGVVDHLHGRKKVNAIRNRNSADAYQQGLHRKKGRTGPGWKVQLDAKPLVSPVPRRNVALPQAAPQPAGPIAAARQGNAAKTGKAVNAMHTPALAKRLAPKRPAQVSSR